MNVKFTLKRFLVLMAAIMAAMTFTACPGEDSDPDGGENGSGGVSGKRIKTVVETSVTGEIQRMEHTYNSNGDLTRIDRYDASSKRVAYWNITNNSDGTWAKTESFAEYGDEVFVYSYDANKKPIKAEGTVNGVPSTYEFTYQNGRRVRAVLRIGSSVATFENNYDNNGRRTTTTETLSAAGTQQYTRTYNSDGTLQKITATGYSLIPNSGSTETYTWENGKRSFNDDDYIFY